MMRNSFFKCVVTLGLMAGAGSVAGQTINSASSNPLNRPKKPAPLTREISGGFRLNSDGWSLFAERGNIRSLEGKNPDMFNDVRIFQLEFTEHKDPKETKQTPSDQGGGSSSKPFIYGKINNFYALKIGYGIRKLIAGKPEPGTVSIHWANTVGLALGMEKPYYIDGLLRQDNGSVEQTTFKYTDANKSSFTDLPSISGGAGFMKGIGEIQMVPGINFKSALHFDFAATRKTALAVETGFNIEYYSRPIVLMAYQDNRSLFASLFASFQFGRRK